MDRPSRWYDPTFVPVAEGRAWRRRQMPEAIHARGVRVHNLKGIDVSIPTLSGRRARVSGWESSLAFEP